MGTTKSTQRPKKKTDLSCTPQKKTQFFLTRLPIIMIDPSGIFVLSFLDVEHLPTSTYYYHTVLFTTKIVVAVVFPKLRPPQLYSTSSLGLQSPCQARRSGGPTQTPPIFFFHCQ